jgi:hypothetical protein
MPGTVIAVGRASAAVIAPASAGAANPMLSPIVTLAVHRRQSLAPRMGRGPERREVSTTRT